MSIPSSPPPLPEELFNDPPSSPPSSPPLPLSTYTSRKRHADYYDSSLSSDPIFSEDISEESDLNGGVRKKRYTKGPWYGRSPLPLQRVVASNSRNVDSGVWMGSDSSTDSLGGCNRRVQTLSFQEFSVKRAPAIAPAPKAQTPEQIAADMIFKFVDACQQSIDLSEMRLCSISNETLRPLHQLIRLPIDMNDNSKITSEHYAPLTPEIKLFLAKNELAKLPSELWNLGNITVLSLRNNELTEIPPSIARLRKLQELNIAGNQLSLLPWELLNLVLADDRKLLRLSLSPNPFIQPLEKRPPVLLSRQRAPDTIAECVKQIRRLRARFPVAIQSDSSYEALYLRLYEILLSQLTSAERASAAPINSAPNSSRPMYVSSSKTTFLDTDGSKLRTLMRSSSRAEPTQSACLTPNPIPSPPISAVPSLFELGARSCARSPFISQLSSLLPDDASPPVTRTLQKAISSKEVGLEHCSVCAKQYVVPRAEWVEFWFDGHGSGEQFLPFLRRACSWGCVGRLRDVREGELERVRGAVERAEGEVDMGLDNGAVWSP